MPPFLIALIIVVGGFWLIRNGAKLPAIKPASVQKLAGAGIMAFSGLLLLRGEINVAIGLFVFGMGLYGKSAMFPEGMKWGQTSDQQSRHPPPPQRKGSMSRDEALQVLGLKSGATADDIKQTHKRLIKELRDSNEQYLRTAVRSTQESLADLRPVAGTYDAHGKTGESAGSRIFDKQF